MSVYNSVLSLEDDKDLEQGWHIAAACDSSSSDSSSDEERQPGWHTECVDKLKEWQSEATLLSDCHSRAASLFNTLFRVTGCTNIVFSAGAATLSLSSSTNSRAQISMLTLLSTSTVILTGIQSFFAWNVRREIHSIISAEYASLVKKIDHQLCLPEHTKSDMRVSFYKLRARMRELQMRSPVIPRYLVKISTKKAALVQVQHKDGATATANAQVQCG